MIKVITLIRYLMVLQLSALLWACVQAPQPQQQSYWHVKAQDYMQSGLQYYQRQQFRQALNQFDKSLHTYQRFNEINGELDSRINLAKTAIALDLVELARQQIDEAQKIISAHGLSDKTVYLDIMSSSIAIQQLDLQQAAELLEKYPGHGEMQDDVAMALLINKIRLALLKGNDASALLEEFNSAAQSQAKYLPRALRFQAQQAHLQQRYADSDELYAQALSHYRERADSTGVVAGLKEWGANLLQRNEWKQAALRYQDLYKIAVSLKQQAATVAALDGLIQVYEQQGNQRQLQWARQQMGKLTVTP